MKKPVQKIVIGTFIFVGAIIVAFAIVVPRGESLATYIQSTQFWKQSGSDIYYDTGTVTTTNGLVIEARIDDPAAPAAGRMWVRTDL